MIYSFRAENLNGITILTDSMGFPIDMHQANIINNLLKLYKKTLCNNQELLNHFTKENEIYQSSFEIKKVKSNANKISSNKRMKVFELHGNRCLSCNSAHDVCIDHIIPVKKGGSNDLSNLQPLCRRCNSRKMLKSIDFRINII